MIATINKRGRYTGYCRGGPWADRGVTNEWPDIRVPIAPLTSVWDFDRDEPGDMVVTVHHGIYRWRSTPGGGVWDWEPPAHGQDVNETK